MARNAYQFVVTGLAGRLSCDWLA